MKKLYHVKIEYDAFKIADSEEEAIEDFWENVGNNNDVDTFINDITCATEIEEAQELNEVEE